MLLCKCLSIHVCINVSISTCEVQRFGQSHQSDVVHACDAVVALVGDDVTHRKSRVEQRT